MTPEDLQKAFRSLASFRRYGDGWLVDTTAVYPSGKVVQILVHGPATLSVVTDNGSASDELECSGIKIDDPSRLLRPYARKYGLETSRGEIFESRVTLGDLPAAIRLVASASAEAVHREIESTSFRPHRQIRDLLATFMKERHGHAFTSQAVEGKNRPHLFDYVHKERDRLVIVDPVLRDASSINSKVVAHLDVRARLGKKANQLIIYDDAEPWTSDQLGILQLAASIVPWREVEPAISSTLVGAH